jgi:hypothetical protein
MIMWTSCAASLAKCSSCKLFVFAIGKRAGVVDNWITYECNCVLTFFFFVVLFNFWLTITTKCDNNVEFQIIMGYLLLFVLNYYHYYYTYFSNIKYRLIASIACRFSVYVCFMFMFKLIKHFFNTFNTVKILDTAKWPTIFLLNFISNIFFLYTLRCYAFFYRLPWLDKRL